MYGIQQIERDDLDLRIHNNLNYLYQNYPKIYDEPRIHYNVELLLNATTQIRRISDSEHQEVADVWRLVYNIYSSNLITDLDSTTLKGLSLLEIQVLDTKEVYQYMKQTLGNG